MDSNQSPIEHFPVSGLGKECLHSSVLQQVRVQTLGKVLGLEPPGRSMPWVKHPDFANSVLLFRLNRMKTTMFAESHECCRAPNATPTIQRQVTEPKHHPFLGTRHRLLTTGTFLRGRCFQQMNPDWFHA